MFQDYISEKQRSYTEEAALYDAKRFSADTGRFYVELSNRIIHRWVTSGRRERVLDVATGTGRVSVWLAREGVRVFGIDLTDAMLQQAKAKAGRLGVGLPLMQGNALSLPFRENTFDAVVSIRFLHILPSELQLPIIQEMVRVLKPRGRIAVEFNSPFAGGLLWMLRRDHLVIWPSELKRLVKGLSKIKVQGIMLPGLARLSRWHPGLAYRIGENLDFWPLNHLCNQILVMGEKESG